MTRMTRIRVYLREEELEALREAVRQVWLRPPSRGPVALWDGEPRRTALDHDTIYDEP